MSSQRPSENAIFSEDFYPEVGNIFSWKPVSLENIGSNCTVVLDTNVLLLPYSIGSQSLSVIEASFQRLASQNRLRIPGQVAREFARIRPTKLLELHQQLNDKKSKAVKMTLGKYPLLEEIDGYQEALDIEKEINELIGKYQSAIDRTIERIRGWDWDDPLSELYRRVFS